MKKRAGFFVGIVAVVAIAVIAAIAVVDGREISHDKPVVKIGVSLPLSGQFVFASDGMRAVIAVFQEDLAKRSDLKNRYEFILEDNAWNSRNILAAANKLLRADRVDAVIYFGSIVGRITAPLASGAGIVNMGVCVSEIGIADGDLSFMITTTPEDEAKLLASKIKHKYKNIAIVGMNESSAIKTVEAIFEEFYEGQYKQYIVNQDERDFRAIVRQIRNQGPDALVIILYSPTLDIFIRQLREGGMGYVPLYSTHFFSAIADFSVLEGAQFAGIAGMRSDLYDRVFARTHGKAHDLCTGYIYDGAALLVAAFENAGGKSAAGYLRQLKKFDGPALGKATQSGRGFFTVPPVWHVIKNGKPVAKE
ncbi:MAG: ABC transporter substrate-binding protein [Alphaproteobacteria bacterium]|nr:ABC transporter substrate-binding protein [Alphaproteobacteria bacterium]